MNVYTPIYNNGWKIRTLDTNSLRPLGTGKLCTVKGTGTIYNQDYLFTSKEAALNYIVNAPVPQNSIYIPAWTM